MKASKAATPDSGKQNIPALAQSDLTNSSGLVYVGGAKFGRNIEALLGKMESGVNGYWITLRNKPAAVVLSTDKFEELVSIREKYEAIIDEQTKKSVQSAQREFDDLFMQMQSKKSAAAMRNMVNVTADKLAESYKPGRTETK
ncbi:hypothetical protein [Cellvibrio sp. NN19]|uniref:hypothetical protein n=1 Tax=Cellvibrio chitinivorans TaxID=3102792 RepID=UPI002B4079CB|nr:hypothetical protein [Cellvibrio sp. NN19]